jgi:GT2 family glycosyltransferase
MYGEDADLALRAAKAGFRPVITPDSVITHEVGASSKVRADKLILLYQSKATLVRKHWNTAERPLGLGLLWVGIGLRALVARVSSDRGSRSEWSVVWRARRRWFAGYPAVAGSDAQGRAQH